MIYLIKYGLCLLLHAYVYIYTTASSLLLLKIRPKNALDFGISKTWAYHCTRCNYVWLPKDFDLVNDDDLLNREPPKACARCKSKQWKDLRRRNLGNKGTWNQSISSIARLKALKRTGNLNAYNERKKIVATFAHPEYINDCMICNQPTSLAFISSRPPPLLPKEVRRYLGQGVGLFYPDGKPVNDSKIIKKVDLKKAPVCCNKCHKKHFQGLTPITPLAKKRVAELCTIHYPSSVDDTKDDVKTKLPQVVQKPKPELERKPTEAELKEMEKIGTIGECCVCHKAILRDTCIGYGLGYRVEASKEVWDKYGLNGRLMGLGVSLFYPDKKRVDMSKIPIKMATETTPMACKACRKKYFKYVRTEVSRAYYQDLMTPITEEAWKACTIPYPIEDSKQTTKGSVIN
jgi:hypothetical protein